MKKIVLISDTHDYLGKDVTEHMNQCDEIWHAGDIGSLSLLEKIESFGKVVRAVYGNIDAGLLRTELPLDQRFDCEGVKVFMTHIGGYPGRYTRRVKDLLEEFRPDVYICGHSHILKVMPDKNLNLLHMNPGACGVYGFHKFRTFLRFQCKQGKIEKLEAIDLGLRARAFKPDPKHSKGQ